MQVGLFARGKSYGRLSRAKKFTNFWFNRGFTQRGMRLEKKPGNKDLNNCIKERERDRRLLSIDLHGEYLMRPELLWPTWSEATRLSVNTFIFKKLKFKKRSNKVHLANIITTHGEWTAQKRFHLCNCANFAKFRSPTQKTIASTPFSVLYILIILWARGLYKAKQQRTLKARKKFIGKFWIVVQI